VSEKLNLINKRKDNLAPFRYMLRCCFAHGTARPIWYIQDGQYKTTYQVGNKTINASQIANQQAFDYSSIGSYGTLWYLKIEPWAQRLL